MLLLQTLLPPLAVSGVFPSSDVLRLFSRTDAPPPPSGVRHSARVFCNLPPAGHSEASEVINKTRVLCRQNSLLVLHPASPNQGATRMRAPCADFILTTGGSWDSCVNASGSPRASNALGHLGSTLQFANTVPCLVTGDPHTPLGSAWGARAS